MKKLCSSQESEGIRVCPDITEPKCVKPSLGELEGKYKVLFEEILDAVFVVDAETSILIDCNRAACELVGRKKSELIGQFQRVLNPPEISEERLTKSFKRHVKEGGILESQVITKKGEIRDVEIKANVFELGGRKLAQGIFRDITERKQMEEKLRQYSKHLEELVRKRTRLLLESEEKYSVLVEKICDIVIILQDGKIILINKTGEEIVGKARDELIGLPFEIFVTKRYRQQTKERYMMAMKGQDFPAQFETELIARNGKPISVEASCTVISHQGRPALLTTIRDITERKRMEDQRLKLEKLAAIGELSTMVAHDLRNPLTSIKNASFYLKNTCPNHAKPKCKTAIEMLDTIEQETLFANNIITDLLDFAAKRPLQLKRQDINNLVAGSITRSNVSKNIKIETKFAEQAIAAVDEKQLKRVFLNLIKNAVQAMPNGGKLTITTNETTEHTEIIFTDTGMGIPRENMDKIFRPLFTTKAKGIGMGLGICKKIVEQHAGTIHVKSKIGTGTVVTVKLPKKEGSSKWHVKQHSVY